MSQIEPKLVDQIIFLGVAEKVLNEDQKPYPDGKIDIFRLTKQSHHIIFPANIDNFEWVFLFNNQMVEQKFKLQVLTPADEHLFSFEVAVEEKSTKQITLDSHVGAWIISSINFPSVPIETPGQYKVGVLINDTFHLLGTVFFNYQRIPPFTSEQIDAIKSNPYYRNAVQAILHCKHCDDKAFIYTSLDRIAEVENKGYIWQHDLKEDSCTCKCGDSIWNLKYIRESMHGMLLHEVLPYPGGMSYQRYYAHSQIMKTINDFNLLIENEKYEEPLQKFIEKNTVLLAMFAARKIFFKKHIVGKYETDIIVYDTNKRLLFIELERANLRLFKNDGHPTAVLNHAYEQVKDWLIEYSKHPFAILESLELSQKEVASISGVVIAGRSKNETANHLDRHLSRPSSPDIDFFTFDELGKSLAQISRELA